MRLLKNIESRKSIFWLVRVNKKTPKKGRKDRKEAHNKKLPDNLNEKHKRKNPERETKLKLSKNQHNTE
jgi:hypothetical protein